MRNLDELRWEQFHIGDIFSVERPSARNKDNYEDGDVPFVASGAINNGVMKCCKPKDDEKLDKRECITVSPVDGSTFYQAYDFLGRGGAGSSVLLLRSAYNELLSGQFIARMISQTCSKYTYGHMGNKESIKREIIQLPTTDEYKPDYQYMASYSNQKRLALLEKYRVYAKTRIAELGEPMEIPAITQKKWEPVLVSDIFDILSGKRLVAADTTPGDRPFIGALDNSNGIARFVNDTNVSLDKNVLGVNYDGNGMVIGFYHPYESRLNKVTEKIKQETPADEELKVLMITHKVLATQQGYEKLLDILNDGLRDKEDPFLLFFMETVEPIYHALNTSDMQLLFDILGIKRYPITKKVEKNKWKELQRQLDEARKKRAIDVFEIINRTKLIPIPPKLDGWYHLYQNTPETIYASNTSIEAFLNLDYAQFIAVKDFLHPEAQYSTEHGVKGEEYDNVIFVISKGWNQYQFETYAPMITKKAVIPSGKQASFERNRNLFYVCCSRPKKRLIFFVTVPIDSTFKSFLVELVGEQNIFTFSQYIERKSIK